MSDGMSDLGNKFVRILKKKRYVHDPVVVFKWNRKTSLGVRVL